MPNEFEFSEDSHWATFDDEMPDTSRSEVIETPEGPHVPMRESFPPAGSEYMGGASDGWEYRTVFGGSRLAATYDMLRNFLNEEGYGDIPLPANADELKRFRRPRQAQLQLFLEQGYIHNPIKILFPADRRQRNNLILCIYNEKVPGHLLRFHGLEPLVKT